MNDAAARARRPKVLVVDDQPANLIAASKILAKLPVEVTTAGSGNEALGLLLRHEFAVILLDVRMPGMDGYETATLIRDHTGRNPVPIIFVTAEAGEQQQVFQGYESGAVDYLLKPIEESLLLSKLRIFLELYERRRELAESTRALAESNRRLQRLLHAVGDGILGVETDGSVGLINPAACRMLECTTQQVLGKPMGKVLVLTRLGDGPKPFEMAGESGVFRQTQAQFRTLKGREFPVEYVLSAVESGHVVRNTSFVLVFQDITERLKAETVLRRQAELDHLTGLANRLLFEQRMQQVLGRGGGHNRPFGLLLMDLDGFKAVNDQHGHAVGDFLLKAVADRLRAALRTADLPARLGGDEFAIYLDGARNPEDAMQIGQKVAAALSEPYDCGGQLLKVGASVGVALYPTHGKTVEALVNAADAAMYRAKKARDSSVVLAAEV